MKPGILLPWLFILLVAIGLPTLNAVLPDKPADDSPSTLPTAKPKKLVSSPTEMMGKYAFGWAQLAEKSQLAQFQTQLDDSAETLPDRLAAAVLSAELVSKESALERLSKLDSPDAAAFAARFESGTPLPPDLLTRYGFFARVAATHGLPDTDPARAAVISAGQRTAYGLIAVAIIFVLALLAGIVLFILAIVFLATGSITLAPLNPDPRHSLYLQAFALYLGTFILGSVFVGLIPVDLPFIFNIVPLFFAVAIGIAYPLLRGLPGTTLRRDWGLHTGKNPFLEVLCGAAGYLAGLPLIAIGLTITVILSRLTGTEVSHPITEEFENNKLALVFLAVVFAPITEEILFRGGFLAHCRSFAGPIISGLITGLIFAAIHPQGWAGIPMLTMIGFNMALLRQWRSSLIAPITAHAINNGFVVCLLLVIL